MSWCDHQPLGGSVFGVIAQSLPGTNLLQELATGLQGWAIVVGTISLVLSGLLWALGVGTDNAGQATRGKRGVMYSLVAVAFIGAGPTLVNWAFAFGNRVQAGG